MRRPSTFLRRCAAGTLAISLSLVSVPSVAAPSDSESPEALYNEGRALYETADYEGAIKVWTKAYAKLQWTPANAEIKAGILYNLAGAHEEAFGINGNATHLNKAMVLLKRFDENVPQIYGEGPDADAERDRIQQRIDHLQEKLDEANASGAKVDEPDEDPDEDPTQEPQDEAAGAEQPKDTTPDEDAKSGKVLMITGGVIAGIGVAAGGAAVAFLASGSGANDFTGIPEDDYAARMAQIDRGNRANTIAGINTGFALALLTTGVVLLAVGAKKSKKAKSSTATLTPYGGPGQAGMVLSGRF
jgi:tetratricopeptide (TPR) repeat protein